MLTWSDEFATGSPMVDTQHRMLIDRINHLENLLKGPPPSKTACDELLGFLEMYAGSHFKFEEQCMERHHCPAHERNRQAHSAFLSTFAKFKARYLAEGPKPDLLAELQTTAGNWIKDHILTVDVQLKACLK